MSAALPAPLPPITFTGINEQEEQAPTPPRPLLARAATMPATMVPWPWSSLGSPSRLTASYPWTNEPCRSGCERSMPVSRIATTVSAAPVVTFHAAGAFVFESDHDLLQRGSLGAAGSRGPTGDCGAARLTGGLALAGRFFATRFTETLLALPAFWVERNTGGGFLPAPETVAVTASSS